MRTIFINFLVVTALLLGIFPANAATTAAIEDDFVSRVSIAGPIISLPNTRGFIGEWEVARAKVIVKEDAKIDQTAGKVTIGAFVEIKGIKLDDGSIKAIEIVVKFSPPSGLPVKFSGKIEDLPSSPGRAGDWKVSGRVIHVSASTKIDQEKGQVAVGALVDIEGLVLTDGSINAIKIEVKPDFSNGIPVKFLGKVEKLPSSDGRLGEWVVSGRTLKVTERTVIRIPTGVELMIGSVVEVEGLVQNDGTVLASKIEVKNVAPPPPAKVHFRGVIESLPETTGFIGVWAVSGRKVVVSADTKINEEKGKAAIKALVEVEGLLQADGSVKAVYIAVREETPAPGYIKFLGVIKSLPVATTAAQQFVGDWKVGERVVHVFAETKIEQERARVQVGALVEVEGYLRNDGSVDAKRIEVKHLFNDTANYVRFFGFVKAYPETNTRIGEWSIGDKKVYVYERTRIKQEHGAPRVGSYVEVEGNQRSDGSIDAFTIEVERNADAPEGAIGFINFYGQIKSLPDASNFVGEWGIGDKKVVVDEKTKIEARRGTIVVRAFVEVFGYLIEDGTVRAIKIEVRPAPANDLVNFNRSFVEFIGKVEKLPDSSNYVGEWVVAGRTIHVYKRTQIFRERAKVEIGAMVEVVGAELPNGDVDAKLIEVEHGPAGASFVEFSPLTSVNAGSYQNENSASSIIASFGANLATTTEIAKTLPLPTTLGGVTVLVDGRPAGLFFVSPNQINYLVPEEMLPGRAMVTVVRDGNVVAQGALALGPVAPSLFTANSSGQGVPAGLLLRIKANGQQSFEPLAKFDPSTSRFVPLTITRNAGDRLFLIFYGTGLRGSDDIDGNSSNGVAENIQVTIGGVNAKAAFAGAAPGFAGLDQLNIEIPTDVTGPNLQVIVKAGNGEGKVYVANIVTISVQ